MSTICVWNTAFLGDAVLTLPLIQTLREAYPASALHFWVRRGFAPLFAAHPAIDAVFEYDKRGGQAGGLSTLRLGRRLGREGYSLWVSAHSSPRSALLARWSSAKIRIGYKQPRLNAWFYTHTVDRRFAELEEIERLEQLLLPLGLGVPAQKWPRIVLPQEVRDKAEELFQGLRGSADAPVLGVHPGSIWGTKRWLPEYFADVAARAVAEGAKVMLFAGPGEESVARQVRSLMEQSLPAGAMDAVLDLSGALSLVELAACLGRLSCYLTNDSGPMHLAWPQGTPVAAVFGPTVRRLGFFPRGEHASVLEISLDCRPCGLHGPQECPLGHHNCMRLLTPDLVWPVVLEKLSARHAAFQEAQ